MTEVLAGWGWIIAIGLQGIMALILRSMKNAFASKEELQAQVVKMVELEGRLRNMPAANAMHELAQSIERLRSDIMVIGANLTGTKEIMTRLEATVTRHEQIFSQGSR